VNRPSLRIFSLQTGSVFFGFTQPSQQHITDRMEARLHMAAAESFCFAIADRQLDQLSTSGYPPIIATRSSIRQIVAQTMQDDAAYQLFRRARRNRGFVFRAMPKECAKYGDLTNRSHDRCLNPNARVPST
jgi:hypothetical protein